MQEASFWLPVVYTTHRCARPAERSAGTASNAPLPLLLGVQLPPASLPLRVLSLLTSLPGFWADPPVSLLHLHFRSSLQAAASWGFDRFGLFSLLPCLSPKELSPRPREMPAASRLGMFPSHFCGIRGSRCTFRCCILCSPGQHPARP